MRVKCDKKGIKKATYPIHITLVVLISTAREVVGLAIERRLLLLFSKTE